MVEHTPGPWHIRPKVEGVVSEHGDIHPFTIASGGYLVAGLGYAGKSTEANARLIAAVPGLLEAAKTIIESLQWELDRSGTSYNGFESLKAAITKAEEG